MRNLAKFDDSYNKKILAAISFLNNFQDAHNRIVDFQFELLF